LLRDSGISVRHAGKDIFPMGASPTGVGRAVKIKGWEIVLHRDYRKAGNTSLDNSLSSFIIWSWGIPAK
jgi:hypothetical protein